MSKVRKAPGRLYDVLLNVQCVSLTTTTECSQSINPCLLHLLNGFVSSIFKLQQQTEDTVTVLHCHSVTVLQCPTILQLHTQKDRNKT